MRTSRRPNVERRVATTTAASRDAVGPAADSRQTPHGCQSGISVPHGYSSEPVVDPQRRPARPVRLTDLAPPTEPRHRQRAACESHLQAGPAGAVKAQDVLGVPGDLLVCPIHEAVPRHLVPDVPRSVLWGSNTPLCTATRATSGITSLGGLWA